MDSATKIFRAMGQARLLLDNLIVADHHATAKRPDDAAKALDDAELWLKQTASMLGYTISKPAAPAAPDALDTFVAKVNAMALGVRS